MSFRADHTIASRSRRARRPMRARVIPLIGILLAGCAAEPREPWLGVNLRLGWTAAGSQPASAPAAAPDHDLDFKLVGALGMSLVRVDLMDWSKIQNTSGAPYNFSASDRVIRLAQRNNIDILAVCANVPGWAAVNPPARLPARQQADAFVAFVQAFVERYDGDGHRDMPGLRRPIRAYECFEKPEIAPTPDYALWLKRFYDATKAASPKSLVVLGSLRSPGLQSPMAPQSDEHTYFERLLTEDALQGPAYPCFDVVGFHNFPRQYPGRPAFEHAVAYLRQAMAARGIDRPIWLTAFGADSNDPHAAGEDRQAADLVCWTIHARTLGIDRLYLHTLHDTPPDKEIKTSKALGLVRPTATGPAARKPAFQALAMLLDILRTSPQVTRRADGIYMLSGDQEPTYVLWRVARYDPSSFLIPGWWEVRTLAGQRFVRQGADIKVTDQPIFLQRTRSPFIQ